MAPSRESAYSKVPGYRVDLVPNPARIRVRFAGETIADSARSLIVQETRHDPVLYLPREDLRMEHFHPTQTTTFCPFKGDANYFSLVVGDARSEDAVWSYEDPFPEVVGLKDYVAFYRDRIDEWIEGEDPS